ncbi:hypothetical protein BH20ACT2_BH20ACT2_24670 [soil metagenome]
MELTPKLLTEEVEFRETFRGYDRNEVDDFLERVAVAVGQLQQQLADAITRGKAAEARAGAPGGVVAPAPAARAAPPPAEDPTEELRRTLVLAQRTADAAIKEAHEEADRLVDDARTQAERLLRDSRREAERDGADRRLELQAEVEQFEAARRALQGDVELLEQHLEDQRESLRNAIAELQRLVDEPEGLAIATAPETSDIDVPASSTWTDDEDPEEVAPPPRPARPIVASPAPVPPPPASLDEPTSSYSVPDELAVDAIPAPAEYAALPGPDDHPGGGENDDAFLAELRKAMTDDEPLGPRDDERSGAGLFDQDDGSGQRQRPRFGRRR